MAKGVANNFLHLLEGDLRASRRRILVLTLVVLGLAGPAWLLAGPMGLAVHGGVCLLALCVGLVAGRRRYVSTYQASLKVSWNRWMRYATSCESIPEVYRKVTNRSHRNLPYIYAAVLTILWVAETGLLLLALDSAGGALALPIVAANAVVVGLLLGFHLRGRYWYRSFSASLQEMVKDGEVGVWGVV